MLFGIAGGRRRLGRIAAVNSIWDCHHLHFRYRLLVFLDCWIFFPKWTKIFNMICFCVCWLFNHIEQNRQKRKKYSMMWLLSFKKIAPNDSSILAGGGNSSIFGICSAFSDWMMDSRWQSLEILGLLRLFCTGKVSAVGFFYYLNPAPFDRTYAGEMTAGSSSCSWNAVVEEENT